MKRKETHTRKTCLQWLVAFCLALFALGSYAQPTITGFTPVSGPTGDAGTTTVTITGTEFSATATENVVMFGAVKATVTAATTTQLTVTAPWGATWQPLSVTNIAMGLTAYSYSVPNPFIPTFASGSITAASFAPKVDFTTGTLPRFVAIGDLDGDGKPDLVVANFNSSSVSVFRNTSTSGSITAASFATKVDFTTGTNPFSVAIGDLDGDGKPDLAAANYTSNTVSVFRNTSTSGSITTASFATKVDFTTGTNPFSVAIGDLDGDGKPDLAAANNTSNTVSVFRNTSTSGSITAASFATKVDFTTGTNPCSVAIGDLDGDGKPDLAAANYTSNTVSVFRNTSISGSITAASFATKVDFTTGANPRFVAIGDLDGDGKPDLAVANNGSSIVSVFRNTSTSGSITTASFATKVDFTTGATSHSVAIGDLDGDGKPDLAVTNYNTNTVSVFRNTSTSGSITAASFATKVDFTTGSGPYFVAIGDLDGDGKPDLAVANNDVSTVSVLSKVQVPVITSFTPASGPTGDAGATTVTISGTGFSATATENVVMFGAVKATVTAATTTTLTVTAPWGATWQPLSVTNTTTGLTAYSYAMVNPFIPTYGIVHKNIAKSFDLKKFFTINGGYCYNVAVADFDLDGKPDIAATNSEGSSFTVLRNTSTSGSITSSSFAPKLTLYSAGPSYGIDAGDLDGDGKPDLVLTNSSLSSISVLRNTSTPGTISFATKVDFSVNSQPRGVTIGDLDGDGKPDLAVANNASYVSILRNTSTSGTIDSNSFDLKVDIPAYSEPRNIVICDFNLDGKPDLGIADQNYSYDVLVLRNTSTGIGSVSFDPYQKYSTGSFSNNIVAGDLDGDNKADLAVASANGYVSVFCNTSTIGGAISFASRKDFSTDSYYTILSIGDMDGDGKPDMVASASSSGNIFMLHNISTSGSVSFANISYNLSDSHDSSALVDLDGNGKTDLLFVGSGNISVLRSLDLLTVTSFTPVSGPTGTKGTTTVTITGKEFSATASKNVVRFGAVQATVTAATTTQLTVTAPWGATWQPLSVTNTDMLQTAYCYAMPNPFIPTFGTTHTIDEKTFAAHASFATGTNPVSVAIGDFDSDGKPDLAVANQASAGTVSVFLNTSAAGSITASSFTTKVDFTVGTNPCSVATGDFDSDGKPDLAVVNISDNTVSVLLNSSTASGSAAFATAVNFTVGTNASSVAIGDINGDSTPDLVVANAGDGITAGTVSVLLNTSTGDGSASFAAAVNFTAGIFATNVAIGDFDSDGKPDLAVANAGDGTVSVLLNASTGDGLAAFDTAVDFTVGSSCSDIAIGDLDSDGKPDLAVTNGGSNTVSVLLNNSTGDGSAAFATAVDITANAPVKLTMGDLDGDGKPDLAVVNNSNNTVSVFRNTCTVGTVLFDNAVQFPAGSNPMGLSSGDLNGDGKPEITVTNFNDNTVWVLSAKKAAAKLWFSIP